VVIAFIPVLGIFLSLDAVMMIDWLWQFVDNPAGPMPLVIVTLILAWFRWFALRVAWICCFSCCLVIFMGSLMARAECCSLA